MDFFQSFIYGIVQGITEFLPISSTAHLILVQKIFSAMNYSTLTKDQSLVLDVALHLGTVIAVIFFFFKDWVKLITAGVKKPKSSDGKLFWFIMVSTIPAAILGLLFEKVFESAQENLLLISIMLILLGVVLYFVDKTSKSRYHINDVNLKSSLFIGLSQAVAMIPGVSRSGITMTTGRFLGLTRESAARFAFLMSTPTIIGLGLYKSKDIIHSNIAVFPFIVAIITSGIVGALSIRFLLMFIKKSGFKFFAIYRCVLGVLIILALILKLV